MVLQARVLQAGALLARTPRRLLGTGETNGLDIVSLEVCIAYTVYCTPYTVT
jgi:hypothetical protein